MEIDKIYQLISIDYVCNTAIRTNTVSVSVSSLPYSPVRTAFKFNLWSSGLSGITGASEQELALPVSPMTSTRVTQSSSWRATDPTSCWNAPAKRQNRQIWGCLHLSVGSYRPRSSF